MARLTIEDCLNNDIENRFMLVLLASKRARDLTIYGKEPFVERHNDKPTVVALREIASEHIAMSYLDQKEEEPSFRSTDADVAAAVESLEALASAKPTNSEASETMEDNIQIQASSNPSDEG